MKKMFGLALVFLLFLSACSVQQEQEQKAKIKPADLTQQDKTFLKAGGAKDVSAFDYHLPQQTYKYVDLWVDVYKNGEHQKLFSLNSSIEDKPNGRLIFTLQHPLPNSKKGKYVATVRNEDGMSQAAGAWQKEQEQVNAMTGKMSHSKKIKPGEPITLSVKISDPDASSMGMSNDVYEDEEALKDLTDEYKYVYVLRGQFRKTEEGGD